MILEWIQTITGVLSGYGIALAVCVAVGLLAVRKGLTSHLIWKKHTEHSNEPENTIESLDNELGREAAAMREAIEQLSRAVIENKPAVESDEKINLLNLYRLARQTHSKKLAEDAQD